MAKNIRGTHVSPGIYTQETDITYAVKSLGITTLGLVGETLKGPAFQPMPIENWRDFKDMFGGTSADKFLGSQYPKYELPYIAKSYLTESNQLQVCRVLGLSGYNAGPAWAITADGMVVAVLRSRGHYEKYYKYTANEGAECTCPNAQYDKLVFEVGEFAYDNDYDCLNPKSYNTSVVEIAEYVPAMSEGNQCSGYSATNGTSMGFGVSLLNLGKFTIKGLKGAQPKDAKIEEDKNGYFAYSVSLNPSDNDYILKVLGTEPFDGTAPLYVESLYDVALIEGINKGTVTKIDNKLTEYNAYNVADFCALKPINGFLTLDESALTKKYVGTRWLADSTDKTVHLFNYQTEEIISAVTAEEGRIYTVRQITDENGKRSYVYGAYDTTTVDTKLSGDNVSIYDKVMAYDTLYWVGEEVAETDKWKYKSSVVLNNEDDKYYRITPNYNDDKNHNGYEYVDLGLPSGTLWAKCNVGAESEEEVGLFFSWGLTNGVKEEEIYIGTNVQRVDVPDNKYTFGTGGNSVAYQVNYTTKDYTKYNDVDKLTLLEDDDDAVYQNMGTGWSMPTLEQVNELYTYTTQEETTLNGVGGVKLISRINGNYIFLPHHLIYEGGYSSSKSNYTFSKRQENSFWTKNLSEYGNELAGTFKATYGVNFNDRNNGTVCRGVVNKGKINQDDYVKPVLCDLNNYKDAYRYASTPWFVSNLKGDSKNIELNKLFRFHTISDGNNANNEVKISIQNIKPNSLTFDIVIRDINDSDESVIVLEKYSNCSLKPGDQTYIAYKIGSFDGIYEAKSKYVTVEVNENILTENSVPCGFLGYPLCQYDEVELYGVGHTNITNPTIQYNVNYNQDIKHKRQYFGLSNLVGVDLDMFTYKGKVAYGEDPRFLSQGFHLDSRLALNDTYKPTITVDGVKGYTFDVVPTTERTMQLTNAPIIGNEIDMEGSIYENIDLRKFTCYFYGGFDGWDIYREHRTNTDEFKINKYKGDYNNSNGEGYSFDRIEDAASLGINQPAITSDWYAYLAGIRQFANPEEIDINVFATPGIDIINNKSLVEETIEMIEEERADSIYVVTMPDKPFGADDHVTEMYTPTDAVYELENTDIDSNYTCTYYPWVKYHDTENNKYVFLPATKDVVRNMAMTDNKSYSWFAPAGISRGDVNCVRAKLVTKLADEDALYEGRINPVKTFASDGVKIWGQKNLQIRESVLNRIAVRRLLLRLRKLISISCIGLIFDPNDPSMKNKFLSTVTPILDNIKGNRGISDYRIEVDDSAEARDRRELPCKIYFKPYGALEYITLDFVVTNESVSFDNI